MTIHVRTFRPTDNEYIASLVTRFSEFDLPEWRTAEEINDTNRLSVQKELEQPQPDSAVLIAENETEGPVGFIRLETHLLIVIIILLITAFIVSRNLKLPMTVSANAHSGDLTLEPCDYKTKSMTYKTECGTLIVPENRLDPSSRLIALPVKRIHAENNSPL